MGRIDPAEKRAACRDRKRKKRENPDMARQMRSFRRAGKPKIPKDVKEALNHIRELELSLDQAREKIEDLARLKRSIDYQVDHHTKLLEQYTKSQKNLRYEDKRKKLEKDIEHLTSQLRRFMEKELAPLKEKNDE